MFRDVALRTAPVVALCAAPTAGAQSFDQLLTSGRAQLDSGKIDPAVKTFERAVKLNPASAEGHFQLGRALGSAAQKASVLRQPFLAKRIKSEFERAVELDARHLGARDGLIQFYLQAPGVMGGSVEKARQQAAGVAQLNALRGHFAHATIAIDQKDSAAAERAYLAAATEYPDSLNAITAYVNMVSARGRAAAGFVPLDRFLSAHPDNRVAQFWFGRTAAISGLELERGEALLRGLLASPSTDGPRVAVESIHFRLGDIALKRGDRAAARAAYTEALKINPRLEPAKRALAALK